MANEKKNATPKITVQVLKGKVAILAGITQVQAQGKALETLLHTVAVSILLHVEQHNEVSLANKLIENMPNLARKNALIAWFLAFGKIGYSEDTKKLFYKKTGKTNSADALQEPFWVFKPEAEYKPMDFLAQIKRTVNTATERLKAGVKKGDNIPADKVKAIQKILAA